MLCLFVPRLLRKLWSHCGNSCSCDRWGGEEGAAENFSSSHQQSEWIQKGTACPRLRPSSLDSIYKFAFTSLERPDRYKEVPGQDRRADQPAGEEGAGGVAEEAAESLHWRTSQCLSAAVREMVLANESYPCHSSGLLRQELPSVLN